MPAIKMAAALVAVLLLALPLSTAISGNHPPKGTIDATKSNDARAAPLMTYADLTVNATQSDQQSLVRASLAMLVLVTSSLLQGYTEA